jgi:hypothetical protein
MSDKKEKKVEMAIKQKVCEDCLQVLPVSNDICQFCGGTSFRPLKKGEVKTIKNIIKEQGDAVKGIVPKGKKAAAKKVEAPVENAPVEDAEEADAVAEEKKEEKEDKKKK